MSSETISGRVVSAKETGIKIEGRQEWLNYSRYGDGANVPRAVEGEFIVVTVEPNKAGSLFIQSLTKNGHHAQEGARRSVYQEAEEGGGGVGRQLSIVRQVCLKAAVDFYGMVNHQPEACGKGSDHVLQLATRFEDWVIRKDEA